MVMKGNLYVENVVGAQRSVVHVEGFPNVWSVQEKYIRNENWFELFVAMRSVFTSFDPNDTSDARKLMLVDSSLKIDKYFLINYPDKSESILTVWRPANIRIDGTVF